MSLQTQEVLHCDECYGTGWNSRGMGTSAVRCKACNGTGHVIQIRDSRDVFVPQPGEPAAHVVEGSIGNAADDANLILKNPNWPVS